MQILLKDNAIDIFADRNDKLSQPQINQIKYFGFSKTLNQNHFQYLGDDVVSTALELINFFDRKSIPYKLSNNLREIKDKTSKEQNDFSKIKMEATDFKNGIFDKDKFNEFCSFVNTQINRKLKPHQIKAAYHHYILKNAANFSVPGSGKTTTVITVYEKLKQERKVNTLFVVGPPSSFTAWKTEFGQTLNKAVKALILSGR
ncbi:MAG: hypothetical protein LBE13_08405, partial [Bacteroidales bacterium]|nr:hypothetical protein [Bacteroidales bacterium]